MNEIHHNKEQKQQRIGSPIKKIVFILSSVFFLVGIVLLVAFHVNHEKIWTSYKQAVTQTEKAQASMQELTKELDTLIVDEQKCLSNVNDSTFCSVAIELSQKAHETAKKIERTENIAKPKAWIYSADLLEKIRKATKQVQAYEKECILLNKEMKSQIENLEAAYLDKALTDYTSMYSTMQSTVDTLQALISSTQGTVTDDTVRQDAQNAITTVQEILNTDVDENNLEELRTATSKLIEQQTILEEKSKAITASRDAWQAEQDRAAKQAAATAEAEQDAQKYKSYGSSSGGSSNNNNSGSSSASSSGGDSDDTHATWDIPDYLNESRDVPLPDGFIPYG
ncbi:hypothetical protein NG891_00565 [Enterococcus gallinarum]|uniref:hypothetical protein n=1 Tax=Enterococcus gallinarum TaxID=1353 RepID=UPI0020902EF0|nr:hypothetical protein [Enterococcus gallinarum]MCO5475210.1 hypothetical protein [Enterococcus gallinarum]